MNRSILIAALVLLSAYQSYSQELWGKLTLPENMKSEITCFATSGDEVYLGTNREGVWYTRDFGANWVSTSDKLMLSDSIGNIIISPTGSVFATGRSMIYKTADNGKEWLDIYDIQRAQDEISCIAVSPKGALAIGTPRAVYYSDRETDGSQWYKISTQLEKISAVSIFIDVNETVFVSGTQTGKTYAIFRYADSKNGWILTVDGIKSDPKVTQFTTDENYELYAAIGPEVYQLSYDKYDWSLFVADQDEDISRMRFSNDGDLTTLGKKYIKIYPKKDRRPQVLPDFDASTLRDIILDKKNKIIGIGIKDIIISNVDIKGIIDWVMSTKFTVIDPSNGNPYINSTFKVYKATCDADQAFLKDVKTNSRGEFSLAYSVLGIAAGDHLKVEKTVKTVNPQKSGHEALDNTLYEIRLNNCTYDGDGVASYYKLTSSPTQTIELNNTVIYHNLLISVEWEAKRSFLDTLESWVRLMSDFYYDVTDGQLIINKVAIYDNKIKWDQADVRFFASNQVWPNAAVGGVAKSDFDQAQVRMPRRWWGNGGDTRNLTSRTDWFTRNEDDGFMGTSSTLAHELGHYMLGFYDEYVYVDTNKAKLLPAGYNYGFMDYQYQNGNEWSSELSSATRYPNSDYKITAQWSYNGSDCWTQFENKFEGNYVVDGITFRCPIKKPSERTLSSSRKYLLGPMDYMTRQATCSVRNIPQIQIIDQNSGSGDFDFICVNNKGTKMPNVEVTLFGSTFLNYKSFQGKTDDGGLIKALGANVGDFLFMIYNDKIDLGIFGIMDFPHIATIAVNAISSNLKNQDAMQDVPEAILKPISGRFEFLGNLKYDANGSLQLNGFSEMPFPETPSFLYPNEKSQQYESVRTEYNSTKSSYLNSFNTLKVGESLITMAAKDSAGNDFNYPFFITSGKAFGNNFNFGGEAEVMLEDFNESVTNISILSGGFPASRNGIKPAQEHAGKYHSIATYPKDFNSKTISVLNLRYQRTDLMKSSENQLRIFKWDETGNKWNQIGGIVDTAHRMVSSPISSSGTYTLFTVSNVNGVNDNPDQGMNFKVTPNPVAKFMNLEFNSTALNTIQIKLYNSIGIEVSTAFAGSSSLGYNSISYDVSALESGVYYAKLFAGNRIETAKFVVIK